MPVSGPISYKASWSRVKNLSKRACSSLVRGNSPARNHLACSVHCHPHFYPQDDDISVRLLEGTSFCSPLEPTHTGQLAPASWSLQCARQWCLLSCDASPAPSPALGLAGTAVVFQMLCSESGSRADVALLLIRVYIFIYLHMK